jgi:hypothetical protein
LKKLGEECLPCADEPARRERQFNAKGGRVIGYLLFVIREEKKRSAVNGQQSSGKMKRLPFLRGWDALVLKESGHPAHIFIVAGASCSRPSMERPAPCFAKPMTPPLL